MNNLLGLNEMFSSVMLRYARFPLGKLCLGESCAVAGDYLYDVDDPAHLVVDRVVVLLPLTVGRGKGQVAAEKRVGWKSGA